jgi:hypothetical protein
MAVMAALGSGTAFADTVICDTTANPCAFGDVQPAGSYITTGSAESSPAGFRIGSGSIEWTCSYNVMAAKSKQAIGNPLSAQFEGTLSGCTKSKTTACDGSFNSPATTMNYGSEVMRVGSAAEPLAVTFICGKGSPGEYSCTFKMKDTLTLEYVEEEARALYRPMYLAAGSSGTCTGTSSSPLLTVQNEMAGGNYLASYSPTGALICKTAEVPCTNESNWYGAGTPLEASLKAGTKATFSGVYEVQCSASAFSGQLTGTGGKGQSVPVKVSSASFTGCGESTTVTAEGLPWTATIHNSGAIQFQGVKVKIYRGGLTCTFGGTVNASIVGNSEIVFKSALMSYLSGSFLCNKGITLNAAYSINAPNPFYLTWI